MEIQKKCSYKKHGDIESVIYCIECKVNLCNKCTNYHSDLFENHHTLDLKKNINEIFTGICSEMNHKDELDYYCKDHNKLCCSACLSKIKDKGKGHHHDCNIYFLEEVKDEKKIS